MFLSFKFCRLSSAVLYFIPDVVCVFSVFYPSISIRLYYFINPFIKQILGYLKPLHLPLLSRETP